MHFVGRDNYVNNNLENTVDTLDDSIDIISENSAKNWNNELLTGFSAIATDSSIIRMKKCNDGPVNLQFNAISTEVDDKDNIILSIPSYYSSSYMLCASATLDLDGQQTIFSYNGSNMPNTVLGADNTLTNYPGLSINESESINVGLAINNSTANNGIALNNSENLNTQCPGISINNSSASLLNFAINDSVVDQQHTSTAYFQFAANNAKVKYYGFALQGIANMAAIAIGTHDNECYYHSIAYKDSIVSSYSLGLFDSIAFDYGIATHKSYAQYGAVSQFNSSANYDSLASYDSTSLVTDITAGHNISVYNSNANVNSISLHIGSAHSGSVAMFDSTAVYDSFAFNNSQATTDCLAMMSSHAGNSSFAFNNCNNSYNKSFAFNNCPTINDYSIGLSNCVVLQPSHIAAYNVTAAGIIDSKAVNVYSIQFNAPTVRNISGYIANNIALYNSTIGYATEHFPANVFTGFVCGSDSDHVPAGSATFGKYKVEQAITKFDSNNAGNNCMSYYSSTIEAGISASLAMFDSVIDTDAMILTPNGQDSDFTSLSNNNIAMYGSTLTNNKNHVALWNNKVTITERGSINDNIFIDMNIKSNVAIPDYSLFFGSSKDSSYYFDKHIFIIA